MGSPVTVNGTTDKEWLCTMAFTSGRLVDLAVNEALKAAWCCPRNRSMQIALQRRWSSPAQGGMERVMRNLSGACGWRTVRWRRHHEHVLGRADAASDRDVEMQCGIDGPPDAGPSDEPLATGAKRTYDRDNK